MKMKITRKQMVQLPHLYRVGYCDAENLLAGLDPLAYTTGIYGWNCDVYALPGGVHICTGYRGLAGDNIPNLKEFETAAKTICSDYWGADKHAKLDDLRRELATAILSQEAQE